MLPIQSKFDKMKKNMIIVIGILFCCSVNGQKVPNLNLSFNHLSLSVKDLNHTANFYKNVLGLQEISNRTKKDGIRWFSLGEGKELHLISLLKDTVIINKAVHFALTTINFDLLIKTLIQNKVAYNDWPGIPNKISIRADGIKQVYFQDPNGYWIEVNSVGQK